MGRDVLPSVSWLKENLSKSSGEEVVGSLEEGLRWLERMALDKEADALFLAAAEGGDDVEINADGEGDAARIQWRRLRSFLGGIKALCVERGISCGAGSLQETKRKHVVVSPPLGLRTSKEVVAAVSAAAARTAEAGLRPSSSDSDDHRWDGWLVFAVAVTLASSEDRPFLCRCALQSVWGDSGLPRIQMIELLCKMYVALRPAVVVKAKTQGSTTGFQAASGVSYADTWDGAGSYRLRNDLLQCIYALESYFVR